MFYTGGFLFTCPQGPSDIMTGPMNIMDHRDHTVTIMTGPKGCITLTGRITSPVFILPGPVVERKKNKIILCG